jgi:hypothetical protein
MRAMLVGILLGLALGLCASALAANGGAGFLLGWTVMKNGSLLCSDPFVWPTIKEIDCE